MSLSISQVQGIPTLLTDGLRQGTFSFVGEGGEDPSLSIAAAVMEWGIPVEMALGIARNLSAFSQTPVNLISLPLLVGVPTATLAGTGVAQTLTLPTTHPTYEITMGANVVDATVSIFDAAGQPMTTFLLSDQSDGQKVLLPPGYTIQVTQANTGTVQFTGIGYSGLIGAQAVRLANLVAANSMARDSISDLINQRENNRGSAPNTLRTSSNGRAMRGGSRRR